MKTIITAIFAALVLSLSSCTVIAVRTVPAGPPGWHKNPNNPHHPATTNPGHTKHHENPSCRHK